MSTDRWQQLDAIFTEAIAQPASLRGSFLDRRCGGDAGMRNEVASLLAAAAQTADFLATPALDVFARQVSREGWSVQPGDRIGSYTVTERLGSGGMGEVWRARDGRIGRDVAIKLLLPHPSNATDRVAAFQREARAAGALNHTNILTVYDVGEHGDAPYLVTECLDGQSLRARLGAGAVPLEVALDVTLQVARGLGAAHARGVVHRDLKPENIFLAADGRVKILDFGLATLRDTAPRAPSSQEHPAEIRRSLAAGTAGYMAPEQLRGDDVDGRADIFALGAVLYEMLAGRRPFERTSTLETLDAIVRLEPRDLADVNPAISPALCHVVHRSLAKSREDRFATVDDLASACKSIVPARTPASPRLRGRVHLPMVVAPLLVVTLVLAAGAWRWQLVTSRARWASTVAAPEAQRLADRSEFVEAFLLARQALDIVPDDPRLRRLFQDVSIPVEVTSEPAGAGVELAAYQSRSPTWVSLGTTPLHGVRVPRGFFRVRASKAGFQPVEGTRPEPPLRLISFTLDPLDTVPPGMVRIPGSREPMRPGLAGELDDFWIDQFEVTNRQFKEFVDHGGYHRRDYWQEPFVEGGRSLPWEEALARFHDSTGRPGPATWASGTYPAGQDDFPVGGVSWYEAAAYAAFAGKSLPTVHHWYLAARLGRFADILTLSNFSGEGPTPVGSGLGPFGTYDMAGNVKEWCSTETAHGRFLLGGAWNEPRYVFGDYDASGPFERAPANGFRVAKYIRPLSSAVTAPVRVDALVRDVRKNTPVDDGIFALYRRQFAYDRAPLNAVVEATEETDRWVKHTVAFDTAHGGERMRAFLFLPKTGTPPYQTVIFFPGGDAFALRSSRDLSLFRTSFVISSGRAFLYPVYKGTYERTASEPAGPNAERDIHIAWSRDLGRAIDYLETRPEIDRDRLAYYGLSGGAGVGVFLTALEPRLKTSVLQGAAIWDGSAPEIDPLNYAPRVRIPTLMLNALYDFDSPVETAQRPLFDLLGTPGEHKRHKVFESGHALPVDDVAREMLPWLDRYLGPVVGSSTAASRSSAAPQRR